MKFSIKIWFLKLNHFLLDAGMLSSFCKSSTSKYHLKAVFTPNDHIKEKKFALPSVTNITVILRRSRVLGDNRRKPYSNEYSTMYFSSGHTEKNHQKTCNWLCLEINHIWYHNLHNSVEIMIPSPVFTFC